jgi:folylpolyglutamate synthase/dihydropteroate synthase
MVFKGIDQHRWSLGLERMKRALDALGHPEKDITHVLVAGTNGKGSTCIYLERMLLAAGRTVGTTLSPHVSRFLKIGFISAGNLLLSMTRYLRSPTIFSTCSI